MLKTIDSLSNLLRAVATFAVVAALGTGGWLGYRTWTDRESALARREAEVAALRESLQKTQVEVQRLTQENKHLTEENHRLEMANRLLKVDRRVARLHVLDQYTDESGKQFSKVQFVEVNEAGKPLGKPREFTVEGDTVYIDAWVAKFEDAYVEQGVPMKDKSIVLFRALFGKNQKPSEGFPLDQPGSLPLGYRGDGREPSPLEMEIWTRFWELANDPAKAKAVGLRAPHGEAPYMRVLKGKSYRVQARYSDGLSIVVE